MSETLSVYVDGFNLYHGLHESAGTSLLWLDLVALAQSVRPHSRIVKVKYFTATVLGDAEAQARQDRYIAALKAKNPMVVEVVMGRYQEKPRHCKACGQKWVSYEEKETDVNIAIHTAEEIAAILTSRAGRDIPEWEAHCLLYYAQAWHLAVTGTPLFEGQFVAHAHGPALSGVLEYSWHAPHITLTPLSSDLIDLVLQSYGSLSGDELSALTRTEQPWREACGTLSDGEPGNQPLREKTMASYYRAHRRLGGQTAADIAVGGIAWHSYTGPIDVPALLAAIPRYEPIDSWGGANMPDVSASEVGTHDAYPCPPKPDMLSHARTLCPAGTIPDRALRMPGA